MAVGATTSRAWSAVDREGEGEAGLGFGEDPLEMPLAEHDGVIQAFASDTPDQPLDVRIHSARVRAVTEDCTGCTWVRLTVLPGAQGIEEKPADPSPGPADEGITWGQIK